MGFIIFASLIAGIPMFTNGILHRFLISELEQTQTETGKYPGMLTASSYVDKNYMRETINRLKENDSDVYSDPDMQEFYKNATDAYYFQDNLIREKVTKSLSLTSISSFNIIRTNAYRLSFTNAANSGKDSADIYMKVASVEGLQDHIKITSGRIPETEPVSGVYEAVLPEYTINKYNITVGDTVTLSDTTVGTSLEPINVKVVGVYTIADSTDPFWLSLSPDDLYDQFMVDYDVFRRDFIYEGSPYFYSASWFIALNYQEIEIGSVRTVLSRYESLKTQFYDLNEYSQNNMSLPCEETLVSYAIKSAQLLNLMWALYVPVIIMLVLYLFMVSNLIIEGERNEIALLTSRGAGRMQVTGSYLIQGLIIGAIALAAGPPLSYLFNTVLGACDGFLAFAHRKALKLSLETDSYIYALYAMILAVFSIVIPAFFSSKTSIVNYKRRLSRGNALAFWEKTGLDFILLGLAAYGYYQFTKSKEMSAQLFDTSGFAVDPTLFIVPVFFIIGIGLLFIRIYPLLIRLIYWLGKRFWNSEAYLTLTQVGRGMKNYHFLMLFLVMIMSVGTFNSVTARTINNNIDDRVQYSTGCDLVLAQHWTINKSKSVIYDENAASDTTEIGEDIIKYYEPPFSAFESLDGVEAVAKVFRRSGVSVSLTSVAKTGVEIYGINPHDYALVSSLRANLLPYHLNAYMNMMMQDESICIISQSLADAVGAKTGSTLSVRWTGTPTATFIVGAIVDYWPGWNPNKDPDTGAPPLLLIGDLTYIQDSLNTEPYDIWLKLEEGASAETVYNDLGEKNIYVSSYTDKEALMDEGKNDPYIMTINGTLTLGFTISMFICFFGFLIYWILSIRQRTLQFGIFRAMGLSTRKLGAMIVIEQILTSAAAVLAGAGIGLLTSIIYVPFFELYFDPYTMVPPFRLVSRLSDRLTIYSIVIFSILLCLCVIGLIISRIKINQALKLGED